MYKRILNFKTKRSKITPTPNVTWLGLEMDQVRDTIISKHNVNLPFLCANIFS